MKLYERCANDIADLIRAGVLRPGQRLPSVRDASIARGLSRSTISAAHALLEARGLIEARTRSGYYVRAGQFATRWPEPENSTPDGVARAVVVRERVFELLGGAGRGDLVPLGSAFPSPALCPISRLARHLWTAMREVDPWQLIEGLAAGSESLRGTIVRRYALDGMTIAPSELVLTHGAMEGLGLCLQAVTRPGDIVVVESPTFHAALQALERLHLQAVEVATAPGRGIDLDALAAALGRQRVAACWLMPNFQNPLGSLMPEEHKRALVALLARHGIALIEDDVFAELYFGAKKPLPAKAFDRAGLVMHCGSFSKCLAPGYHVGWVAGGRFAARIERLRQMDTLSSAIPSEAAIAAYLDQGGYDRHLRQLRTALAGYQALAVEAVQAHFPAGTRMALPRGGYFLWLELPERVDAVRLQALARDRGVGLAPGPLFSADRRFTRCVRLNYGHGGDARFVPAMRTVGEIAKAM